MDQTSVVFARAVHSGVERSRLNGVEDHNVVRKALQQVGEL